MNPQAIHQQISDRLDQLTELHRKMFRHLSSIPQVEIDDFLQQVKQLYESALLLNQHNSLRTIDEMEMAIAEKFKGSAENPEPIESEQIISQDVPESMHVVQTPEPEMEPAGNSHVSTEQVMVETSNKVVETKASPVLSKNKKVNADLHELFEEMPTLANQFKDHETLAKRMATKQGSKGVAENMQHQPIQNLELAIGINEKFQFINHLFAGDSKSYHQAVNHLNNCDSLNSATEYVNSSLLPHYNWNLQGPPAALFLDMIERRFQA